MPCGVSFLVAFPVDGTRGGGCVDTGSRVGQRGTVGPLYKNRR